MKFPINTNFQNYMFTWNQHVPLIERVWLDHRSKVGLLRPLLRPSIQFTYFPLVWCSLYGLRAFMYILAVVNQDEPNSFWEQFWLRAGEKYSRSSSLNIHVCMVIWTVNYLLVTIKDFGLTFEQLKFLIIYNVGTKKEGISGLQPKDLGLSKTKYLLFSRFRRISVRMIGLSNKSVVTTVAIIEPTLSLQTNQFTKYPLYTFASVVGIIYWAIHACQAFYSVPGHVVLTSYYLKLRQDVILERFEHFIQRTSPISLLKVNSKANGYNRNVQNKRTRCFMAIHNAYQSLLVEMGTYVRPLAYFLFILLSCYCTIIVYLIYIVFLNTPDDMYLFLFSMILTFHLISLATLLVYTAQLAQYHAAIVEQYLRFAQYNWVNRCVQTKLKIMNLTETMIHFRAGFVLWNDFHMDKKAMFIIAYHIGLFFFLFFRHDD